MNRTLADVVRQLADAAGWKPAPTDSEGVCRYLLEDGLDLEISSPDGRVCVFSADLGGAPDAATLQGAAELVDIGKAAAAVMRSQASVLSIDDGRLTLYQKFDMNEVSDEALIRAARTFLNDQAWWRGHLSPGSAGESTSPFSFDTSWFPSEIRF